MEHQGVLGGKGSLLMSRGFPKTHPFAQARLVFEVARARSAERFTAVPGCITLWELPANVEDEFDARWAEWLEDGASWSEFSVRKADDMMMDRPGGDAVDQHRRCWAGRGGQTPTAAVRVSGAELGYQTDLDFIFPSGLAVFKAGGDLAFHHGGCSLQEMVVPVITLRMPSSEVTAGPGSKVVVEGYPSRLTNRTFGCRVVFAGDIFNQDAISARVVLIGDGQEVGRAGMAPDAEFDRTTATVQLPPLKEVSIGMILNKVSSKKIRIIVQDPATDAVLAQSEEIEVGEEV